MEYARVTNNAIRNVDALSGIHLQGTTDSVVAGNRIFNVGPISQEISNAQEGCGINDLAGTGNARNAFSNNTVTDAYCGVAYVTADWVDSGSYFNKIYSTFNSDNYPTAVPRAC